LNAEYAAVWTTAPWIPYSSCLLANIASLSMIDKSSLRGGVNDIPPSSGGTSGLNHFWQKESESAYLPIRAKSDPSVTCWPNPSSGEIRRRSVPIRLQVLRVNPARMRAVRMYGLVASCPHNTLPPPAANASFPNFSRRNFRPREYEE
jgi:hypothetical protein